MTLELIPSTPDHADEIGRICHEAYKDLTDRHHFPPMFPSSGVARQVFKEIINSEFSYGVTAMVTYNSGKDGPQLTDDGQSFLIMLMNDENGSSVNSSMYDYQLKSQSGPINVLHLDTTEKQVRLQCWV